VNNLHEIALTLISGIGNVLVKQLVSYCGSAEMVFKTPKGKLQKIPGIGEKLATIITTQEVLQEAEKQLKTAEQSQTKILFYTDALYPQRLKVLHNAPAMLYIQGQADLNKDKIVSIVGTRAATDYGKSITEKIIADLTPHNPLIVSGLAYGIDIAAHKAALKYQLPTLGVMASGLQTIYPLSHQKIAEQMKEQGGVTTEYPFGTKPDAPRFPERNRIIAGLADVVIVVETGLQGGTLITVEQATEYKKPILAVPGNLGVKTHEGCNHLISNHKADIYTGIADLENTAGWTSKPQKGGTDKVKMLNLTADEQRLYELLEKQGEMHIDDLLLHSQVSINQLANLLLNLEFQGLIDGLKGKRFKIKL
jgi:DNA processing protein